MLSLRLRLVKPGVSLSGGLLPRKPNLGGCYVSSGGPDESTVHSEKRPIREEVPFSSSHQISFGSSQFLFCLCHRLLEGPGALINQGWCTDWQPGPHQGAHSTLPASELHFNKFPRSFLCALKLEKNCHEGTTLGQGGGFEG